MGSLSPVHWLLVILGLVIFLVPVRGIWAVRKRKAEGKPPGFWLPLSVVWLVLAVGNDVRALLQNEPVGAVAMGYALLCAYWAWLSFQTRTAATMNSHRATNN